MVENVKLSLKNPLTNDLVNGTKSLLSLLGILSFKQQVSVNSVLVTLHSSVTCLILAIAVTLLTMKDYFGEHIECDSSKSDIPPLQIVRHCWAEGAFSSFSYNQREGYSGVKGTTEGDHVVYHRYYQWVYFLLVFQSLLFYLPKYIWQKYENNRLKIMITDLRDNHVDSLLEIDKAYYLQEIDDLMLIGTNFFCYYIFADILCFVNLIFQIFLNDLFLDGSFSTLGYEWYIYKMLRNRSSKFDDPLMKVFPRQVKCTFEKYGFSGTLEQIDSLCTLNHNTVNEKIFLVLWFWYVFLIIFAVLVLTMRLLYFFPYVRRKLLGQNAPLSYSQICEPFQHWFILYMIARSIKASFFMAIMDELRAEFFDKRGLRKRSNMFQIAAANHEKVKRTGPAPPEQEGKTENDKSNDDPNKDDEWNPKK